MIANLPSYVKPDVPYDDPLTQQRAEGLMLYLIVGFIISLVAAGFQLTTVIVNLDFTLPVVVSLASPVVVVVLFVAVRAGFYRYASLAIVVFAILALLNYWSTSINGVAVIAFAIPIVTAGMLLGWRSVVVTLVILVGIAIGPAFINDVPETTVEDFFVLTLVMSILTALMIVFGTNIQVAATQFVGELNRLQNVVRATLVTSEMQDEAQAALQAINVVRDQLGYTFARIYLVEAGEVRQRVQTGLNMTQLAVDTDFSLNSRSGIYDAIRRKEVIRILEDDDPVIRQHLLTGTRGSLAVPILNSRDEVTGVIDVQSEDKANFSPTEIQTVVLVASQLGQTIERIRLIDNLREDLAEQDELITRQRQRLLQYERAERQTTTDTWRDYLDQRGVEYMGFDILDTSLKPIEGYDLDNNMKEAIQAGDISITMDGKQQIISVPISLRGQQLGAMSFKVPQGSQVVGARQQDLIRNVVQRLSLALENKRLFEQSQAQAKRESKANEVGNLLLSSTDIETVLQLAVENFNEALGAVQTQIRLKPQAQQATEGENHP